jgi:predicted enzyme related to lactoylglutathione lyase
MREVVSVPDAFESLRIGRNAMEPPTDFAERLLGRVRMELGMTTTTTLRDLYYSTLTVGDLDRGLRFFGELFGWQPTGEGHDRGGVQYVSLATNPPMGINNDVGTANVHFVADDLDAAAEAVRAAGGTAEIADGGEWAICTDDQGVQFGLTKQSHGPVGPLERIEPGNVGYVTIDVPDGRRGRTFYASVLGWRYDGGLANPGFETVPMGLAEGAPAPGTTLYVKVTDAAATAERVRELGGTAGTLDESPSGVTVACTDDQGTRFALWQPASGY